jgi:predicted transcriptional regulator
MSGHDQVSDAEVLLGNVADIVAAFVGNNTVPTAELPALIASVHASLSSLGAPQPEAVVELVPAVPVRKSITPDYIVCLEDGRKLKSLKRHLLAAFGLTPEAYREKWGLPKDYPMVAPNYAAARSELAKRIGLGQVRKAAVETPPVRGRASKAKPKRKV